MTIALHRNAGGRFPRRSRPRTEPAEVVRVDPEVWAVALRLAGRNVRRLQVLDAWSVLVLNESPDDYERRMARVRLWGESQ
jgi:hypothetical protein